MRNINMLAPRFWQPPPDDPGEAPPEDMQEGDGIDQSIPYDEEQYRRNALAPQAQRVQHVQPPQGGNGAADKVVGVMRFMLQNPPPSPQQGARRLQQLEAEIMATPELQTDMVLEGLSALKERYGGAMQRRR